MRTWLVLPTYNEAANVERVTRRALAALEAVSDAPSVLVVDDGSPDGTGRIADALAAELDGVHVLHRPRKQGLGPAYLAGFGYALDHGADVVCEMDADLSHDPGDLGRLVAATGQADLVIGSRYVPGGRIEGWGMGRRALSRGGSLYAQLALRLPVRDLTGGFKAFRREALETIDLTGVRANGYVFQVELTYRVAKAGLTVRELPITFRERDAGESKMSAAIALEAVWSVPALRLRHTRGRLRVRSAVR